MGRPTRRPAASATMRAYAARGGGGFFPSGIGAFHPPEQDQPHEDDAPHALPGSVDRQRVCQRTHADSLRTTQRIPPQCPPGQRQKRTSPPATEEITVPQKRASERAGTVFDNAHTVLIGDTPKDIEAGLTAGVRVIAVASGKSNVEELLTAGATIITDNPTDPEHITQLVTQANTR